MPGQFLTDPERETFSGFPTQVPEEDINAYFTLSNADKAEINKLRGEHNQLGFAMQLCALRYLGFSPDDLDKAPDVIRVYVADQLAVNPSALTGYGNRAQTRTDHLLLAQEYLGYHKANASDFEMLKRWLIQRALEHDKATLLLQLACEKLRREKIVRPGITRLERLVTAAQTKASEETYRQLKPVLTQERCIFLDHLLVPEAATGRTPLTWLRKRATTNSAKEILEAIEKLSFLRGEKVEDWDLSSLNPNRQKFLAQIGRKATNQYLQRLAEEQRYPILIAFLRQSLVDIGDEIIDMFIQALWDLYQDAKKDLEIFQKSVASSANENLKIFLQVGNILLDPEVTDTNVRTAAFNRVPTDELRKALEKTGQIIRPHGDGHIDFFGKRYSYIRQFSPAFLKAFNFKSDSPNHPLVKAIVMLCQLDGERGKRIIPNNSPRVFVSDQWKPYVFDSDGTISTRYYELCVLWELRSALRACNIWVENSRKYANLDSYFIPPNEWRILKTEACAMMGVPEDGRKRLEEREAELKKLIPKVNRLLKNGDNEAGIRLEKDRIIVSPLNAEERPESAVALENQVALRLPKIDITDVLIEVDGWTHFSDCLEHASGAEPRTKELLTHLYASILAQACNFGLDQMADITGISYRKLAWSTTWYIREATLKPAFSKIVNYQHKLPQAQQWGSGTLSSSDGQRFPVSVKTRTARPLPKYFGYGAGLTYYTWTSDQLSQYGIKVLPATTRDAPFVLDEIFGNETELEIAEHTVDTAGQTERIFGVFDMVSILFSPRLKDVGEQSLYRFKSIDIKKYRNLKCRFKGVINEQLVLDRWDDLIRIVASFKLGWVSASLALQKLQTLPKKNAISRALQEHGRISKTLHILRWYESEDRRRRINTQLNKGEAIHSLRDYLHFANKGKIRRKYYDEQQNQAACLNLVTNIVITWYTVYIEAAIKQLNAEGYPVNEDDVQYLWPTRFENLNVHGKYKFNIAEGLNRNGLRPLRKPDEFP